MYLLRLDDACEHWDKKKWHRMHNILSQYNIKPLVALIPHVEDPQLLEYPADEKYMETMKTWISEGWTPALHGFCHTQVPCDGGLNPVNYRSEFVGLPYKEQEKKITKGYEILKGIGIDPKAFVAPAHTYDNNTLEALKNTTDIRIVSDTIANDVYYDNELFFIPQQSGRVREMSFKTVTFCYHPNTMSEESFNHLVSFLEKYKDRFVRFEEIKLAKRKKSIYDRFLSFAYFSKRKVSGK